MQHRKVIDLYIKDLEMLNSALFYYQSEAERENSEDERVITAAKIDEAIVVLSSRKNKNITWKLIAEYETIDEDEQHMRRGIARQLNRSDIESIKYSLDASDFVSRDTRAKINPFYDIIAHHNDPDTIECNLTIAY